VVFKGGRTTQGMAAAFSHTGSLASDINIFKAAIHQAGAIFCNSMEDYLVGLKAFSFLPLPKGHKIGVLSNSGGSGVLYCDSIAELNLYLAQFSENLQRAIQPHVIDLVKIQNPLDMIAGANEQQYYEITKAMLQPESGIDIIVPCGVYPPFLGLKFENNFRGVINAWNETGRQKTLIPLFIYAQGYPEMVRLAKEQNIPYFTTPNEAAFATKSLIDYSNFLKAKNTNNSN
jgi:acyl-CoA synthetase (NDP forming)